MELVKLSKMDKIRKIPLAYKYREIIAKYNKKVRELKADCKELKAKENNKNVFDCIRELKGINGSLVIDFDGDMRIPLNDKDKVAVDVLDYMIGKYSSLTVADINEVCNFITFYMEFNQILKDCDCKVHCVE